MACACNPSTPEAGGSWLHSEIPSQILKSTGFVDIILIKALANLFWGILTLKQDHVYIGPHH